MSGKNKEKDGLTQNNSSGACGTSNQTLAPPNPFMPASIFNPVTAPQNPWMSDFSQKLEFIMSKMSTLDTTVSKQNAVLTRLGDIENRLDKHSKEISELQICQTLHTESANQNKHSITKVQEDCKKLSLENKTLKNENSSLRDDLTDLQCRSMRENLLFMGIPEASSDYQSWAKSNSTVEMEGTESLSQPMSQSTSKNTGSASSKSYAEALTVEEDCKAKVYEFCESVLKIQNPEQHFEIDVAHRIGKRQVGKIRPVVAKFVRRQDKENLRQIALKCNLKDSPFNVTEQLPRSVQERRKSLIPKMLQFRGEGKRAHLIRDKLFVEGVEYKDQAQVQPQ